MCGPVGVCVCFLGEHAQECGRVQAGPGEGTGAAPAVGTAPLLRLRRTQGQVVGACRGVCLLSSPFSTSSPFSLGGGHPVMSTPCITLEETALSCLWSPRVPTGGSFLPSSPQQFSSGRRGGRAHLLWRRVPAATQGPPFPPASADPETSTCPPQYVPAPASGSTLEPGGQWAPGLGPPKPS